MKTGDYKKMPVSPFDDPGKSHPFINLNQYST